MSRRWPGCCARGANLDLVSSFVNRSLTEGQRRVLNQLLLSAESQQIHGLQVLIATADTGGGMDELALLANKLRDIENSDAVFALFDMDGAVLLVARSSVRCGQCRGGGARTSTAAGMIAPPRPPSIT